MMTVMCIAVSFFFVVLYTLQAIFSMMGDPVQHIDFGLYPAMREPLLVEEPEEEGLGQNEIQRLGSRILPPKIKEEELEQCSICCEELLCGEEVIDMPECKHTYHEACIAAWL